LVQSVAMPMTPISSVSPLSAAVVLPPGAKILMVDDDPGIRDVVSDFLGKHGYQVDTAGDAREMDAALARGYSQLGRPAVGRLLGPGWSGVRGLPQLACSAA